MKTNYYANRDINDGKCVGLVKIVKNGNEMSAGYYFDGHEWVRDDWRAQDKAYGDNMDYFEIEESEVEMCMAQKKAQIEEIESRNQ